MSSCRSTSFYLAPGVMRYFRDHTLVAALPDGTWVELTHRNDVARVQQRHPGWDGSVLCGPPGGAQALRGVLLDDPAKVERWNLDERVVEGRRPAGAAYPAWRFYLEGAGAVGGARQLADALFHGANKPLKRAAADMAASNEPGAALRLSIAAALQGVISDDELAVALQQPSILDVFRFAPVNPSVFGQEFRAATEWLDGPALRRCATALLAGHGRPASEIEAAASTTRSPDLLKSLASHTDGLVRVAVAKNQAAPTEVLHQLALDDEYDVRVYVASNPAAPTEVLQRLAMDAEYKVRVAVALNPAVPTELLHQLALDDAHDVRTAVASNPAAPTEALQRLAMDWSYNARVAVASNPAAPTEALQRLVMDDEYDVRVSVALNPAVPTEVLHQLAMDDEYDVRAAVASNPAAPTEALQRLARAHEYNVRVAVASNPAAPTELLQRLAMDDEYKVLVAVASNPAAPTEVLHQLAMDDEYDVRVYVAKNPAAPTEVLQRLARAHEYEVLVAVASNPAVPTEVLQRLSLDYAHDVRVAVAKNPAAPTEVLQRLALDYAYNVRVAVASNPAAPTEVLEILARENDGAMKRLIFEYGRAPNTTGEARRSPQHRYATADFHEAVTASETAIVDHPVVGELRAAAVMAGHPEVTLRDAGQVRTVRDLPGYGSVRFPGSVAGAAATLDGFSTSVEASGLGRGRTGATQLVARVLDSQAAIESNAEYMGNCTSGYVSSVARGSSLLVALDDAEGLCQLNIELENRGGTWEPREVNTRFNGYGYGGDHVPEDVRRVADELAARLNSGRTDQI